MLCSTSPAEASGRSLTVHYCCKAHVWRERSSHRRVVTLVTWAAIGGFADLRLFDTFRARLGTPGSCWQMTTQTGWASLRIWRFFFLFPLRSVVRKVSDTAARMVETENDRRGGVERMVRPIPDVFCFDLPRMFTYLRNTLKKTPAKQARGEREPRK